MLDINPVPKSRLPPKARLTQLAAQKLGRSAQFGFPDIAVDFAAPGTEHLNKFGVPQRGCVSCGECCVGCNFHAKNTLDLNYLAIARSKGAEIAALCEVFRIEPVAAGYRVDFKDHANNGRERAITARSNLSLYEAERRLSANFATAMSGDPALNPLRRILRIPATVHSLGGCLMADSRENGVTDANGEVYEYPGLFVLDGSILPSATGVNPAHTIAAVAERNVESAIRRFPGVRNWRASEARCATPFSDTLDSVTIPTEGTLPTNTQ